MMEAHAHQITANNSVIKEKAIQIAPLVKAKMNFSNGWLTNFKQRLNIQSRVLHGEVGSVDAKSVREAQAELRELTAV